MKFKTYITEATNPPKPNPEDELQKLRVKLIHAVTEFDKKASTKADWNHYALGHYVRAVNDALEGIKQGEIFRQAFTKRFTGKLLDIILKTIGQPKATKEEQY